MIELKDDEGKEMLTLLERRVRRMSDLYVADNGLGIEERYFEKIFQISQTLTSPDCSNSAGVGLAIIKKIIENYGGKIWVESEIGKGTTFFFTLPQGEVQREELTT